MDTPETDDGHQTREQEPTTEVSEKRGEQEPTTSAALASGGRRRGRQKVMKKKTMKDEEGYLGTYLLERHIFGESLFGTYTSDHRGTGMGVLFRR